MKSWIILKLDYGQLGNRLHTHANALAWCIRNDCNLLNLSFRPFSNHFQSRENQSIEILAQYKSILCRLFSNFFIQHILSKLCMSEKWLRRLSRFFHVMHCEDHEVLTENQMDMIRQCHKRFIVIQAWNLNCKDALALNQEKIRRLLTPTLESVDLATIFIKDLKSCFDIVVGVHVRRGDYKQYLGGKHFHSWELYRKWICQAKELFELGGKNKVGFFLCSDENPDKSTFDSLPVYFLPQNEIMLDLHALSLCDYSIGPPSSFGTWASWHGKVPRCVLKDNTLLESVEQFSVCKVC